MEVVDCQDAVLNWAAGASRYDRMDFLKRYLKTLTNDEAQKVKILASHQRRNYKRKESQSSVFDPLLPPAEPAHPASVPVGASAPPASVPVGASAPPASVPVGASAHPASVPVRASAPLASVPVGASAPPASVPVRASAPPASASVDASLDLTSTKCWWSQWNKSDILSIDIEKVELTKKEPGQTKPKHAPATVSVVDFWGKEIFSATIKHMSGDFIVNWHTKRINGFTNRSLENGEPMKSVVDRLVNVLTGKLVITAAGEADFQCLGLSTTQFDHFDIQWYWIENVLNDNNVWVDRTIGLRHLYYHYYKIDIQKGVHEAKTDAIATMRLFKEQYLKEASVNNITTKKSSYRFTEFQRLRK